MSTIVLSFARARNLFPAPSRVSLIKAIRGLTNLGLKESKDIVDAGMDGNSPQVTVEVDGLKLNFTFNHELLDMGVTVREQPNLETFDSLLRALLTKAIEERRDDAVRCLAELL